MEALLFFGSLLPIVAGVWLVDGVAVPMRHGIWSVPIVYARPPLLHIALLTATSVGLYYRLHRQVRLGRQSLMLLGAVGLLGLHLGAYDEGSPLPIHLVALTVCFAGPPLLHHLVVRLAGFVRRRQRHERAYWVELEDARFVPSVGGKASVLSRLRSRHPSDVPPGVVVFLGPDSPNREATARRILRRFGEVPLVLRSTAPDEDGETRTMAGHYRSVALPAGGGHGRVERLLAGLDEVVRSYGTGRGRAPVLCMPHVNAEVGGVLFVNTASHKDVARVEISSGGASGVTDGSGRPDGYFYTSLTRRFRRYTAHAPGVDFDARVLRRLIERVEVVANTTAVDVEWLISGKRFWILQMRPVVSGGETESPAEPWDLPTGIVAGATMLERLDLLRDVEILSRIDDETLSAPLPARTLDLWRTHWRMDRALGDALALLEIVAPSAPRELVTGWRGALYSVRPAALALSGLVARSMRRRSQTSSQRHAGALGARVVRGYLASPRHTEPTDELRAVGAASVALRFLSPFLSRSALSPAPPRSISAQLGSALADTAASPSTNFPRTLWHWGPNALDPASPRYAERLPGGDRGPGLAALGDLERPAVESACPDVLDLAWADFFRDLLRDVLVREVARLRIRDASWRTTRTDIPEALPPDRVTLTDLRLLGLGVDSMRPARKGVLSGIRVSMSGAFEGVVTTEPGQTGAGRILLVGRPDAHLAAAFNGFDGVIAESGGYLSHAAIVAREMGVPAVFAVAGARDRVTPGARVRVASNGAVEIVEPSRVAVP